MKKPIIFLSGFIVFIALMIINFNLINDSKTTNISLKNLTNTALADEETPTGGLYYLYQEVGYYQRYHIWNCLDTEGEIIGQYKLGSNYDHYISCYGQGNVHCYPQAPGGTTTYFNIPIWGVTSCSSHNMSYYEETRRGTRYYESSSQNFEDFITQQYYYN